MSWITKFFDGTNTVVYSWVFECLSDKTLEYP